MGAIAGKPQRAGKARLPRRRAASRARTIHRGLRSRRCVIRPRPRKLTALAVTAYCNLRCIGCRYGRGLYAGAAVVAGDCKGIAGRRQRGHGVETVRFYGGEPLLHPDLPTMIQYAIGIGLSPHITTNGLLLPHKKSAHCLTPACEISRSGFTGPAPTTTPMCSGATAIVGSSTALPQFATAMGRPCRCSLITC